MPVYVIDAATRPIPLGAIAIAAGWHRATTIDLLESAGLAREDAEAFTAFIFAASAAVADTHDPYEYLTPAQSTRLQDMDCLQ